MGPPGPMPIPMPMPMPMPGRIMPAVVAHANGVHGLGQRCAMIQHVQQHGALSCVIVMATAAILTRSCAADSTQVI